MRWPPPDGVGSRYPARSRCHRSPSPGASQRSPNSRATPSVTARPSNPSISRWPATSPRTRPTPGCPPVNQACTCCSSARSVWYCFQSPSGRLVPSVATRTTLAPAVCQASAVVSVSGCGVVLKVVRSSGGWGPTHPRAWTWMGGPADGRGGGQRCPAMALVGFMTKRSRSSAVAVGWKAKCMRTNGTSESSSPASFAPSWRVWPSGSRPSAIRAAAHSVVPVATRLVWSVLMRGLLSAVGWSACRRGAGLAAAGGAVGGGLEGGLVALLRGGGRGGGGVLRGRCGGRGGGGCRGGGLGERRLVRGHPCAGAHVVGALNEGEQGPRLEAGAGGDLADPAQDHAAAGGEAGHD